jgi:phosphatidate cytidylyltransferase
MKRLLTALALIPAVTYVVLWANYWVFLSVLMAVALVCYYEYAGVAAGYGFGALSPMGYGAGAVLLIWQGETWPLVAAIALVALANSMRADDLSKTLPRAALLLMGVVYVFGCWKFALPLRLANHHWLMYALLLSWAGDSGAYYIGRAFGKHKMAPRISPQKSWEGAAASVVISVLVGGAYLIRFVPGTRVADAAALTVASNCVGQLGDLAESAIKRGASLKDSSSILPGHGGFLDRVDSTLFTLPVVYLWIKLVA